MKQVTDTKKYVIRDREAGNTIQDNLTEAEAKSLLIEYEETDLREDNFTANFYEIAEMKTPITDTSKAILWWQNIKWDDKVKLCSKYLGMHPNEIYSPEVEKIYQSEHPQPTDTGNTVSSEVGFTGGEWKVYAKSWIYAGDTCIATIQDTGNQKEAEANAQRIVQAVNNHDKLVSALTELIEVFKGAWATDKDKETYYKAIELLNNISNK